ncbi:MAG TPA: triose-phosphate isomerase, partial [Candidatus Thermoplasmatota archaeon]|nr:triose-phosphate isomerase [Candidatus Thermoplasmatota archaeon]
MARPRTKFPRLIVNLKNYAQTSGARAVTLAKHAAKVERDLGVGIALCPQPLDMRACADAGVGVYAQHFDRVEKPESTGWTSLDALIEAGCQGSLINHSEHRLAPDALSWSVQEAQRQWIASVLCTRDSEESGRLAATNPTMIAVEPPELIGGDVSVTTADP